MPPRTKADSYVNDPSTTLDQLRIAAELLGLDTDGTADDLRLRLNLALGHYGQEDEVVCLNPDSPDEPHDS